MADNNSASDAAADLLRWDKWIRGIGYGSYLMAAIGVLFYAVNFSDLTKMDALAQSVVNILCVSVSLFCLDYLRAITVRRQPKKLQETMTWVVGLGSATIFFAVVAYLVVLLLRSASSPALHEINLDPDVATSIQKSGNEGYRMARYIPYEKKYRPSNNSGTAIFFHQIDNGPYAYLFFDNGKLMRRIADTPDSALVMKLESQNCFTLGTERGIIQHEGDRGIVVRFANGIVWCREPPAQQDYAWTVPEGDRN